MSAIFCIVGYGNQGRPQALNLRDGGHDVRVGVRLGGAGEARARADGFDTAAPPDAARTADYLALLVPDEVLPDVGRSLGALLPDGGTLVLAHGSAFAFGGLTTPPGRDAVLVAPSSPGSELREAYLAGERIPAILAVHSDASGEARARALEYASGIGCEVDAPLWASVEEEAVVDLFGEQVVLCGGLAELVGRAFDTLVEAGYPSELAHLECVEQLRLTTALMSKHGIEGMWDRISGTARYGGLETGRRVVGAESASSMREALERIRSGDFFRDFLADHRGGGPRMRAMRREARREALEAAVQKARERRERSEK